MVVVVCGVLFKTLVVVVVRGGCQWRWCALFGGGDVLCLGGGVAQVMSEVVRCLMVVVRWGVGFGAWCW
jgi:hypothetical protein